RPAQMLSIVDEHPTWISYENVSPGWKSVCVPLTTFDSCRTALSSAAVAVVGTMTPTASRPAVSAAVAANHRLVKARILRTFDGRAFDGRAAAMILPRRSTPEPSRATTQKSDRA